MISEYIWVTILEKFWLPLGILLYFILLRKPLTSYIFKIISSFFKQNEKENIGKILNSLEKPLQLFFIVLGCYISIQYIEYLDKYNDLFNQIFRTFIILFITKGLYNLSSSSSILFDNLNNKFDFNIDKIIIPFISRILKIAIIGFSITIIAKEWGYDVNGFIAGLGLGGLAFALAAKDTIANFFGGIIIVTEKPFSIGDWIKTSTIEGTVEDINFRSTKIRTFDQGLVTIPNSTLSNEYIINWSKMNKRRISFNLGLSYNTSKIKIENVIKKIKNLLETNSEIHQETIFVNFDSYNESSLDIFLYFFTKTTNWEQYLKVKEKVNFEILKILEEEEVSVAFPTQSILFENELKQFNNKTKK